MGRVLVATVAYEGGYYSPDKDPRAPIRIYSDRWVEDDIVLRIFGRKRRGRLSRKEYRHVRKVAKRARAKGLV